MKKSIWKMAFGLLLACSFLLEKGPTGQAEAQTLFTLDAAAFQQKGGLVYLEVYLMIHREGLKFVPAQSGFEALLDITLEVHSPDTLLSTTTWQLVDRVDSLAQISPRHKLPDIGIFNLLPGQYQIEGFVHDVNADTTFRRSLNLQLPVFSDSLLDISDIELATRLERSQNINKFYKNSYLVLPNPERLYGISMPMLYYYAEIYNLILPDSAGEFLVDRIILNGSQEEIKRLPQKTHRKVGTSAVEVDGISIASLETGTYYLKLLVEDKDANAVAFKQTKFFVYRPGDLSKRETGDKTLLTQEEQEIMDYDADELQGAVETMKYLLNDNERRSLTALNEEGKRKFLIRFWREHDPDPATVVNEFKQIFEQRQETADQKYGIFEREGWKTDRGRIYVLYGKPDEIEYHTHDLETRPYEIWKYDSLEGGVTFVFVDRNNFGDYRLVHSTKNGEISRPNWFEEEALVQRQ